MEISQKISKEETETQVFGKKDCNIKTKTVGR
jgi:hypothetical protein